MLTNQIQQLTGKELELPSANRTIELSMNVKCTTITALSQEIRQTICKTLGENRNKRGKRFNHLAGSHSKYVLHIGIVSCMFHLGKLKAVEVAGDTKLYQQTNQLTAKPTIC